MSDNKQDKNGDAREYEQYLFEELRLGNMDRRQFLRRASVAGIALSLLGTSLGKAAWAKASPSGAVVDKTAIRGGTLRLGSAVPTANPDPVSASSPGDIYTIQPSLEYLCYPNPDWTLDPRLATGWRAVNSPKVWEFTIRRGVRWHDGTVLTTDDVVSTFERLLDPAVASSAASVYRGILSHGNVEKVSDTLVRFHLDVPFVDFPYLVSAFAYQSAILPKDYEIGSFTKGGIGTGPFILKTYVPHQHAIYKANPNYWVKGLPYLDSLEVRYYDGTQPQVLAMQAGDIDIYGNLPMTGAEGLQGNPKIHISQHASTSYRAVAMRTDQPPFNDKRVRQALALCLNRKELTHSLFSGLATIANDNNFAPLYVDTELAIKNVPQRRQDYAKAKALLAEAGHPNGFHVTLTTENLLEIPQYAVAIKNYCRPAGIDIDLDVLPVPRYYGSGSNHPWLEVPLGITDWAARGTASQAIVPAYICGAEWNSAHWCNKKFDKLFADYNAELDHKKRQKMAEELARIENDEVPAVISYWTNARRATHLFVHGLAPAPNFFIDMRGVWTSKHT